MSLKRIAVLAAVQQSDGSVNNNMTTYTGARVGPTLHGNVNVLLSGAMLSGLILLVFLICYCCHRNMTKQAAAGRSAQYWQEDVEVPLEIFTLPPPAPSPPPAYESVMDITPLKKEEEAGAPVVKQEDSDLPSYEAALRLEAQGYV